MATASPEVFGADLPLSPEMEQLLGTGALAGSRIDIARAGDFIPQIAEDGPAAKRSCALTSQLNAHIARGELDTATALDAQDEFAHNPDYDFYWTKPLHGPDGNWRAWQARARELAVLLHEDFKTPVAVPRELTSRRGVLGPDAESHLRQGGVAYIVGRSVVAAHARLAFEPAGWTDTLFVHDPHYPETTGFYDYAALDQLFRGQRTILY